MHNSTTLLHITDVGAPHGNGVDSTIRIQKQYNRLGLQSSVISAGHSPLHVAFTACADLSLRAKDNVIHLLDKLKLKHSENLPIALNSAPRNSSETYKDAKEDYIYRVKYDSNETFLIYGPQVLQWLLEFHGQDNVVVEKIISVQDIIQDTSSGSQFRSAEYLPIVHFLEAKHLLDYLSVRETINLKDITPIFSDRNKVIVAPSDEYGNGRLILDQSLLKKIVKQEIIKIPGISDQSLFVKESLTEVNPGDLSVWLSSNHFPNKDLAVLNIGTRWKSGTTRTTCKNVINLAKKMFYSVGECYSVKI